MAKATARHILVNSEKLAKKIKKEIISKELTFEKAAKKFSKCSASKRGGNLGTLYILIIFDDFINNYIYSYSL